MQEWPRWWHYELVVSPHVMDRMLERGFTEIDLRAMLEEAAGYRDSLMPGRYCIQSAWRSEPWEVVVEPDDLEQALIVVTAYRVE